MKLSVEEHLPVIKAALERGESYRTIANHLGCHFITVSAFTKLHLPELRRSPDANQHNYTKKDLPETPDELEVLKAEHAALRAAARKHRTVDVQAEMLLQEARRTVVPAETVYEPPAHAEGVGTPHSHVLLLSDLHVGEVVDAEATDQLGEYNWDICHARMQEVQRALYSFQNNRPYPIEDLHIWMLGDMTGGKHHEELAETNEFGVIEQCWRTGKLLGEWIEPLAEAYPRIKVTGVSGNHSRINRKPAAKQVFDSYDWLSYKVAEMYLEKYTTITHHYPRSGSAVDVVAGKTVLLTHGDMIRSSMPGVPWGGVMRRFNELRKTYAQKGVLLDYMAIGHYHQANVVRGIFMNGSVKGPDEYILKSYGTADPPEQLLLTFDKTKQRLTDVSYITLT